MPASRGSYPFMVAVDVKRIALQAGTLGRSFAARFAPPPSSSPSPPPSSSAGCSSMNDEAQAPLLLALGALAHWRS